MISVKILTKTVVNVYATFNLIFILHFVLVDFFALLMFLNPADLIAYTYIFYLY